MEKDSGASTSRDTESNIVHNENEDKISPGFCQLDCFLNFMRIYRMTHDLNMDEDTIVSQGTTEWNQMTKRDQAYYGTVGKFNSVERRRRKLRKINLLQRRNVVNNDEQRGDHMSQNLIGKKHEFGKLSISDEKTQENGSKQTSAPNSEIATPDISSGKYSLKIYLLFRLLTLCCSSLTRDIRLFQKFCPF